MWTLDCTQGFSKIWFSDLVFDPTWHIFELIQTNILTKFHDNQTENVASRQYTMFFLDLT